MSYLINYAVSVFGKLRLHPSTLERLASVLELSTFEIVSLKNPRFYHFIMDFLKAKSCKKYSF